LFANSYIFVLSAVESVTQNEANRLFRFCSSKFSQKVVEKCSTLLSPYLLFSFVMAAQRKDFHSFPSALNLFVCSRIFHTVVVELKIIIEYIAGAIVFDDSIHEFHSPLTASQNVSQNFSWRYSFVNHHVSNFWNRAIGFSHVRA
jgi:hypothetical protein